MKRSALCFCLICFFILCIFSFKKDSVSSFREVSAFLPVTEEEKASFEPDPEPALTLPATTEGASAMTETKEKLLFVEAICQYPEFPTGCESAAAVMVLNYMGIDVTLAELVDEHLEKNREFSLKKGALHGPSPYEYFIGDPRDSTSFGCMAPVIRNAMQSAAGESFLAEVLENEEIPALCAAYIDRGIPVLLWVTSKMEPKEEGVQWYLPDNTLFTWPKKEHCMVLVGYDEDVYLLLDPETGKRVSYEKALVEARYAELGMQAVVIR